MGWGVFKQRREIQTSNNKVRDPNVRHHRAKSQTSPREESDIAARRVRHHSRRRPPPADARRPPRVKITTRRPTPCLLACLPVLLLVCFSFSCLVPVCAPAFLLACLFAGLLVLLVCSPVACLRAVLPACPACFAFLLVRLSADLPAYWDMTPGASSGNWHSRRAKHAVEEDAESRRRECCSEVDFDLLEEGGTEETVSRPERAIRGD